MPLAGEQPGGRVESDPARARHIDLGPGMQVGEILLRPRWSVERLDVRRQLHQIARDETRRQPQMAQDLHQQPAGVAAGTEPFFERLLTTLHARFHPDHIADVLLQPLVEIDQEIDRLALGAVDARQPLAQQRAVVGDLQIGRQLLAQIRRILERIVIGRLLQEEIEGVDGDHLGDHIDLDRQPPRLLRKDQPGQIVAEGVLLPVDEMPFGFDLERISSDRGAAMGSWTQPHHMRRESDGAVEAVFGLVVQGDQDGHGACFP